MVSRNQQELLRQLQSASSALKWRWLLPRQPYPSFYPAVPSPAAWRIQLRLARQQDGPGTPAPAHEYRAGYSAESPQNSAKSAPFSVLISTTRSRKFTARKSRIQQLEYVWRRLSAPSERRERFGNAVTHLEAVSPLATARGYSVTLRERR